MSREHDQHSIQIGRQLADRLIEKRTQALEARRQVLAALEGAAPARFERALRPAESSGAESAPLRAVLAARASNKGLLLGLGDSWFDYLGTDALDSLEDDLGYECQSVARAGTSLHELAYEGVQFDKLSKNIEKAAAARVVPRAMMLSGGGNDVVGPKLEILLNHASSGLPPINAAALATIVDGKMRAALVAVLTKVTHLCQHWLQQLVPIVLHGYDYPVADGEPAPWGISGPWLLPAFFRGGYGGDENLGQRKAIMRDLIDHLNRMQGEVVAMPDFAHVRHVNLRGTLSQADNDYKQFWANELHPTRVGFRRIAKKFDDALMTL